MAQAGWMHKCHVIVMVGSHDRRSLQLSSKMYYYASPTLRSETTLPLKNKTKQKQQQKQHVC